MHVRGEAMTIDEFPLSTDQTGVSARPTPFYIATGNEDRVFLAAQERQLAVLLKGPTGCGKTRFIEYMAATLGVPLITVACHEDLMAADLVGRHLLNEGSTRWVDGPLTRAVRMGAICYLDEVVEARQDTTVVIHPLTDHRRELHIDRLNEVVHAAPGFGLVISYNPGYQSVLKDLKDSTRQRMICIELDFPPAETERQIVVHETGVAERDAAALVHLGQAIRKLENTGLREVASTRTLVAAAHLRAAGLSLREAALAAVVLPLSDDPSTTAGLSEIVAAHIDV
jgi:nitric oxide reductase NorQ protein